MYWVLRLPEPHYLFPHCSGATRSHPSTRAYELGNGVLSAARNAGGAGVCGGSPSINCNGSALVSRVPLALALQALTVGDCEMDEECPPVRTGAEAPACPRPVTWKESSSVAYTPKRARPR